MTTAQLARRIIAKAVDSIAASSEAELLATADALQKRFNIVLTPEELNEPVVEVVKAAAPVVEVVEKAADPVVVEAVVEVTAKAADPIKKDDDIVEDAAKAADPVKKDDDVEEAAKAAATTTEKAADPVVEAGVITEATIAKAEVIDTSAIVPTVSKALAALGAPDAKGNVRKGLQTATTALYLLRDMNMIRQQLARETALEGDGSDAPTRFASLLAMTADAVQALVNEEIGEMLAGKDIDGNGGYCAPYSDYFAYADTAMNTIKAIGGGKELSESLLKALEGKDGPGLANLKALAEEIGKAADKEEWQIRRPTDITGKATGDALGKVQTMHDKCVEMGAACATQKAAEVDTTKAAGTDGDDGKNPPEPADKPADADTGTDDTKKAAEGTIAKAALSVEDDPATLFTVIKALKSELDEVKKQLDVNKRNPPLPAGATKVVEKAQDTIVTGADSDPTDPRAVLKAVLSRPHYANARA